MERNQNNTRGNGDLERRDNIEIWIGSFFNCEHRERQVSSTSTLILSRTAWFQTTYVMSLVFGATNLRRRLEDPEGFVVAPGVYDGLSARLALAA